MGPNGTQKASQRSPWEAGRKGGLSPTWTNPGTVPSGGHPPNAHSCPPVPERQGEPPQSLGGNRTLPPASSLQGWQHLPTQTHPCHHFAFSILFPPLAPGGSQLAPKSRVLATPSLCGSPKCFEPQHTQPQKPSRVAHFSEIPK